MIGAHLDSWDLGTGAVDDGAGIGITVGAAKLILDLNKAPKRTIRVVLFGSEEYVTLTSELNSIASVSNSRMPAAFQLVADQPALVLSRLRSLIVAPALKIPSSDDLIVA